MKPTLKQLIESATPGPWHDVESKIVSKPTHLIVCDYRSAPSIGDEAADANAQLIARCNPETMSKVLAELTWIAERGWNPHGTTIENAHLAYDCHCVAAQLIALLNSPSP